MPLGALRPSPLVEQAAERLREQIVRGHWPVGTKLPGETTLAGQLGVGRSTVREALRALAGAGLVRPRQGSGVFVIATRLAEDWPTRLRAAAVTDVYEVRTLVEVEAARLAALRRTDEDIAVMEAALAVRRAAGDGDDDAVFVDADIALHTALVTAARNPVLTDLFTQFLPVLRQGLINLLDLLALRATDPHHGEASHTALVRAVTAGDAEEAARLARTELEATLALLHSPAARPPAV
ncbi:MULTISPECIES: FadR/GntR family transcriptional regulator [unclassified Streptomyces]|uniref:FadR/GntR family transcriptional regulator n=1 Tax=unclassified Streptomyces TaxID=2593676 RepID=UPI001660413A|nr:MULTISPECIES: FCD domain-containing protein [unclassified Streptomyces]MBD0708695.1 GntR family transcriptional regulator [Streptomyces sp. CBMA291]MBD0714554.1 GntR family transcriptional regulator [Streptomyces sp. CBMA370]